MVILAPYISPLLYSTVKGDGVVLAWCWHEAKYIREKEVLA
jgi:hypothetical protein